MTVLPGRVLAIDPGKVRIGLAVSDPGRIIARGLTTLVSRGRARDLDYLESLVRDEEVTAIVVGRPANLDGTPGRMTAFAEKLAEDLRSRTGLPVRMWDESFTSAEAERTLIEADVSRARRRHGAVDKLAAVLLLQGYLDSVARQDST